MQISHVTLTWIIFIKTVFAGPPPEKLCTLGEEKGVQRKKILEYMGELEEMVCDIPRSPDVSSRRRKRSATKENFQVYGGCGGYGK